MNDFGCQLFKTNKLMLLNILSKGTLKYLPSRLLRINFNISTKINPNSTQMHTSSNSIKSNNQH